VTVASDIARMLAENGIIDNADAFVEYLYSKDYSRVIQEGDFELIKGDTYENIAKIITRQ
jgi:cell division protein YceG involved in septum cleavage